MNALPALFAEIERAHVFSRCHDASIVDRFEERLGLPLPGDIKAFYRRYTTVKLFDAPSGAAYRFVPLAEMQRTRIDIFQRDSDEWGPPAWYTLCDVLDGNFIAMDLATLDGDACNYVDCFHETFARPGDSRVIAKTFTELLARALHGGGDVQFYLQDGFVGYGDGRPLTAESASHRVENPEAPDKGWLVSFTFRGKPHHRFFADRDYDGKEGAFEAVRQYIQRVSG